MISNQPGPSTDPAAEQQEHGCRWEVKPHTGAKGFVDGGWWPRSTDPATEFPLLITAMAALGMPVLRVSYNLGMWDAGGRGLTVRGTVVRMEAFHTTQPDMVTMIGPHGARIRLLVIPPATPDAAARAALRAAADTDSAATAEEILRRNDVPVTGRRAGTTAAPGWRTVDPEAQERREVDAATLNLRAALHEPRRGPGTVRDRAAS